MKDPSSGALAAAGLCLSVALLRMMAPAMPFDWMTFLLIALAALAMALAGALSGRRGPRPAREDAAGTAAEPDGLVLLRMKMAEADWPVRDGGLYDALASLHREKPFAAACAARGALAMLLDKRAPSGRDGETIALLVEALDSMADTGERASDPGAVDALFSYALRALGRLEPDV